MTDTTASRGFTGWHVLAAMLAFFGIVIGANVYLSVEAMRSWTGVVVDNSYASGQDFNEKVQRTREQAALGWTSTVRYDAGKVSFQVLDRDGTPLRVSGVTARITRPIGVDGDQIITLQPLADGSFAAPVTLLSGSWNIVAVAAETPHGAYERRDQIVVP